MSFKVLFLLMAFSHYHATWIFFCHQDSHIRERTSSIRLYFLLLKNTLGKYYGNDQPLRNESTISDID
jgi:hypothetical protein